jgi:class 3 adenylate cyclase
MNMKNRAALRHRLLIFEAMGKRLLWASSLVLVVLLLLLVWDWNQPFLGGWQWVGRGGVLLATAVLTLYIATLFWPQVVVQKDGLYVRSHWKSFTIPVAQIISVTPSKISKHYPVANLRLTEFYRISDIYETPCALIELRAYPVTPSIQRYWFPRVMFTPDENRPGMLLHVKDWLALSDQIEEIREAWLAENRERRERESLDTAVTNGSTTLPPNYIPAENEHLPLILIVDNNPAQTRELTQIFGPELRLLTSGDGIDGLRLARQYKPSLIITDIHLTRLDCREFIAALRKHKQLKETPILLMAGERERAEAAALLPAGANEYILRPFTAEELRYRTQTWLARQTEVEKLRHDNTLLQTKTLSQMAELMRQGELANFLPATVARQVMTGQISGKQESFQRQKVTVLFIDIVGFTDLTGRLDPKLLAELLNDYLREITAVAIAHNGTVDKFIGDAVMVLFGAPQEQEEVEQAWSAVQAGLAMLHTVEQINFIWESRLPRPVKVRVGINTGYCTTGVFGNEMLQSYTAVGSAVNIAARLQAAAEHNSVLCSGATFEHIQERVYYREVGSLALKGINHTVEGFQILALAPEKAVEQPV